MTHAEFEKKKYAHRVQVASKDTGIGLKDLAPLIGTSYRSLLSKLRLERDFTQTELILIQKTFNWKNLEG